MRLPSPLRISLAVLALAVTTTTTVSAQTPAAPTDSIPHDSWVSTYFNSFDKAAKTAGLTPLQQTTLKAGDREIRIWTQVEIGEPKQLYRLTDHAGRVQGELIYYWTVSPPDTSRGERPGETSHDLMVYSLAGRCDGFAVVAGTGICRARFTSSPSWKTLLASAESHGLWTIPDPSTLPPDRIMTLDGWTIVVELRDGPHYRTYRYNTPESHPTWPSAAQAIQVAGVLAGLDSLIPPSSVQRVYRGITTGRYQSAFRSCDDGAEWEFRSDVRSLLQRASPALRAAAPALVADSVAGDTTRYEVEVFGELTPEWLARRWESKFPRVLQVFELRGVRPLTGKGCSPARAR